MASTLRRLSTSLPFSSSKKDNNNTEDPSTSSSHFRRKSSTASASDSSADNDNNFRSLGARDYKLAMPTNMSATSDESEPLSSSSRFRRKSSVASAISVDNNGNFRSLGARDYKLAMDPEEEKGRRSSVADYVADLAGVQTAEGDEEAAMARRGSKGRIYGARDWRLVGKE